MRTNRTLAIGIAVLVACAIQTSAQADDKSATQTKPFDFKGVVLGTSIDEFRKLPHPDADNSQADFRAKSSVVVCTGEKVAVSNNYSSEPSEVMVFDETELALGVKKCIWAGTDRQYGMAGRSAPLSLAGSGYAAYDYSFSFIPDPRDGVLRFYRFEGESNRSAFGDVVEALTAKFGKPNLSHDTVQNGIGNNFDKTTAVWINATSSILTSNRWTEVDKMGIVVSDKRLSDIFEAAKTARKAGVKNPI